MQTAELDYSFPEELIAQVPQEPCRILLSLGQEPPQELNKTQLFDRFQPGDVLVINDSKVLPRRVFTPDGLEILFLKALSPQRWEVLFAARGCEIGQKLELGGEQFAYLIQKGLPQVLETENVLDEGFFANQGEFALPPYIQKARGERHTRPEDQAWYQTAWAEVAGSSAAPTASLHFTKEDLRELQRRGVELAPLTLHVGLGTFLPIRSEKLEEHHMHGEEVRISGATARTLEQAREQGRRIWALGTTAARAVESFAQGRFSEILNGGFSGSTDLYILPGFQFQMLSGLLTNFHQPKSTLLALVSAFAGREHVLQTYRWAIEKKFRLFSYGDLSVWLKP